MEQIPVKKLKPNAILPTYGSAEAAGADLYACLFQEASVNTDFSVFVFYQNDFLPGKDVLK